MNPATLYHKCRLWFSSMFSFLYLCCATVPPQESAKFQHDPNGYLIFCPCMGRYGNQAEHFLGGIAFAKLLNRTLILPPWRTYKNVEFDEWFRVDPIQKYHRAILAKDFMNNLAPVIWPPGKRYGFCYQLPNQPQCTLKDGNPFTNFWDELKVDFDKIIGYQLDFRHGEGWKSQYPPEKYPVIAMRGAPASFPMNPQHLPIQKYIEFSENVINEAEGLLEKLFGEVTYDYVGIHLRNGLDWSNACAHVTDDGNTPKYMASYQCQGWDYKIKLTKEMCFPSEETVLKLTKKIVEHEKVKKLLVATDQNPMTRQLEKGLPGVTVVHADPWLPVVDAYLLSKSQHFVGNCVSSFSAFAWRQRLTHGNLPTSYFGHTPAT